MAGFRNVVPPLGVYSGTPPTAGGGFDTPVPALRLAGGAAAVTADGGFGTPVATLLVRTTRSGGAGFYSIIPMLRMGASGIVPRGGVGDGYTILRESRREREQQDIEDIVMFAMSVIEADYE